MAEVVTTIKFIEDSDTPTAVYHAVGVVDGDQIRCDDHFTDITAASATSQSLQQAVTTGISFPHVTLNNGSMTNDVVDVLVFGKARQVL